MTHQLIFEVVLSDYYNFQIVCSNLLVITLARIDSLDLLIVYTESQAFELSCGAY